MGDLSTHFNKREFECKCGCGKCKPDPKLIQGLEILRERLGGVPLIINSAHRCKDHNKAVGGSPRSQHLKGKAVDVRVPKGFTVDEVARQADLIPVFASGGIGKYPKKNFVHLDVRGYKARWTL